MTQIEKRYDLGKKLYEVFRQAVHGISMWTDLSEFEQQLWVKIAATALEGCDGD